MILITFYIGVLARPVRLLYIIYKRAQNVSIHELKIYRQLGSEIARNVRKPAGI
jgi:hypothetical protein